MIIQFVPGVFAEGSEGSRATGIVDGQVRDGECARGMVLFNMRGQRLATCDLSSQDLTVLATCVGPEDALFLIDEERLNRLDRRDGLAISQLLSAAWGFITSKGMLQVELANPHLKERFEKVISFWLTLETRRRETSAMIALQAAVN